MIEMRYIVVANSNNEHFNADCDFALVSFSTQQLRSLGRLRTAFDKTRRRFKDIGSWRVSDYSAAFLSRREVEKLLGDELFEQLDSESGGDPFQVPDTCKINLENIDVTYSDELVLSSDGVWWNAYPKHSEISVGSEFFSWKWFVREVLTQCVHCGLRRGEHARGSCLFSSTRYRQVAPDVLRGFQSRRHRPPKRKVQKLRRA